MTDLALLPATELVAMLGARKISATELLEHYLERIARLDPGINAVVALDADAARARAQAADAALARGENTGRLQGLPMTIKDSFEVAGMPTTSGAPMLAGHRPGRHADAVERLVAAGANVFGKTNLPLFAGDLQSFNEVFGTTNNPWNRARTPGGSSGGAAAAVAAGLTAFELGSDIGGSIRTPAHFCGIFGHKPSYGIVPMRGHIPGPPGTLLDVDFGVAGPLARSAADLDLGLDVLAGAAPREAPAWTLALPAARHKRLKDYRVAMWIDDADFPTDDGVRARLEALADALRRAGVAVDMAARPVASLKAGHDLFYKMLSAIVGAGLPEPLRASMRDRAAAAAPDDPSYRARFARGATLSFADYLALDAQRQQLRSRWARFFESFDVLLCPATSVVAIPHDHDGAPESRTVTINGQARPYMDLVVWAGLAGVANLPGSVAPVGRDDEGLPVGVQIVGPYLGDRTTIAFAGEVERLMGGFQAPPGCE
ncbi:amidase [Oceanibacterium hippocampi]|uniref:Glutamyl-tRNA(Gln) amidotransferase subunit A n=1 Tax=Oceanibacterium hippocampi TaxID=745714 RepID=A0A1Y5TXZ4_9PROT|nr:amidase [Oceanibacterium hippocampi]SLN76245.1 Glutamyl-tRNA(Gln) amidotransferase subunit A [Oceanibacterium hippocampi]